MLIIAQKVEESFTIDGNITIKILEVKGGQVRIGIDAPKELPVRRDDPPREGPVRREATPPPPRKFSRVYIPEKK